MVFKKQISIERPCIYIQLSEKFSNVREGLKTGSLWKEWCKEKVRFNWLGNRTKYQEVEDN